MAIGIQTYFLVSHPKANIIRLIPIRLYAQKRAVERLRLSQVCDGIDDCSDTLIHEELLLLAEHPGFDRDVAAHPALPREPVSLSHRVGFARHYYDETKRGKVTDGRSGTPRYKRYKRYKCYKCYKKVCSSSKFLIYIAEKTSLL